MNVPSLLSVMLLPCAEPAHERERDRVALDVEVGRCWR